MNKYYTINEVAMMSGLTARTVRNYIKASILSGEKLDGVWRFSEEEYDEFITNPAVRASIQAKKKAIVYDFLLDDTKKNNEVCNIMDMCVSNEEAKEISKFFCEHVSHYQEGANLKFSYEKKGEHVRVILSGNEDAVREILDEYYQ